MTARKTVTNVDVLALKSMVQVCAFAAEAQRILKAIDRAADAKPEVERGIKIHVHAPSNWTAFECPVAEVLSEVAHQLDRLSEDIEAAERVKQ